jgi:hypothetical protein
MTERHANTATVSALGSIPEGGAIYNINKLLAINQRSAAWLGRKCGVSRQMAWMWVKEKCPIATRHYLTIAQAFNVPVSMIFTKGNDSPN